MRFASWVWYSTGDSWSWGFTQHRAVWGLIIPHRPHLLCLPHNELFCQVNRLFQSRITLLLISKTSHFLHISRLCNGNRLQHCQCGPMWSNWIMKPVWWLKWRPHTGKRLRCLHGASTALSMSPWPLGRTEYRPAIDKANSLVPHSPPSRPPLNTHQHEWEALHTLDAEDLTLPTFMLTGVWVLVWLSFYHDKVNSFFERHQLKRKCLRRRWRDKNMKNTYKICVSVSLLTYICRFHWQ